MGYHWQPITDIDTAVEGQTGAYSDEKDHSIRRIEIAESSLLRSPVPAYRDHSSSRENRSEATLLFSLPGAALVVKRESAVVVFGGALFRG